MAGEIYVGDIGTQIIIDMGEDISDGSNQTLYVRKPDKSTTTWSPTIYNSNYLKYVITSGDLNIKGKYSIQPYIEFAAWSGKGKTVYMNVLSAYQ